MTGAQRGVENAGVGSSAISPRVRRLQCRARTRARCCWPTELAYRPLLPAPAMPTRCGSAWAWPTRRTAGCAARRCVRSGSHGSTMSSTASPGQQVELLERHADMVGAVPGARAPDAGHQHRQLGCDAARGGSITPASSTTACSCRSRSGRAGTRPLAMSNASITIASCVKARSHAAQSRTQHFSAAAQYAAQWCVSAKLLALGRGHPASNRLRRGKALNRPTSASQGLLTLEDEVAVEVASVRRPSRSFSGAEPGGAERSSTIVCPQPTRRVDDEQRCRPRAARQRPTRRLSTCFAVRSNQWAVGVGLRLNAARCRQADVQASRRRYRAVCRPGQKRRGRRWTGERQVAIGPPARPAARRFVVISFR